MNNPRRKKLNKLMEQIEDLKYQLEEILEEEQEAFDNIPENLEGSERYEKAEECVSALEDAVSSLEECIDNIDTAIEWKGEYTMKTNLSILTILIGITITIAMNLGNALQYYGMIWKEKNMTVTYRDEIGVVSVSGIDSVDIGLDYAYFTDEDGKDYKLSFYQLLSITKEN